MKDKIRGRWIRTAQIALLLVIPGVLLFWNRNGTGSQVVIDGFVYDSCGGCFTENNPCKPCKVVLELEGYLSAELARLGIEEGCRIQVHNLLYDEQKELLSERLPDERPGEMAYPVLFLDDEALCGWDEIRERFVPAILVKMGKEDPGTVSGTEKEIDLVRTEGDRIVYFKMSTCASCVKTKDCLDEVLSKYENVDLITWDMEDQGNLALFRAYCRMYDVDAEELSVPAVFIGDRCLEGYEEISLFLEPYLEAGYAHDTYCVK